MAKQRKLDADDHPDQSISGLSRLTVTQQDGSFDLYVDINFNPYMSSFQVSPSTISNECMCLGLRRAARAVSRRFDEALRPLDLNNGQFSMLTVIAGMQPVGIQALADHLAMDRTTVTAALKPLQRRGLVEADVSETDSRGRDARLTAAGNTLVTDAIPIWQSFQAQLNGGLAPSEVAHMREFLALLS